MTRPKNTGTHDWVVWEGASLSKSQYTDILLATMVLRAGELLARTQQDKRNSGYRLLETATPINIDVQKPDPSSHME